MKTYYDVFNQSNVRLIDVNEINIDQITPKGIQLADGIEQEFDVIVLATGFDAITGSMTQLDIRGTDGATIHDKWTTLASTYLGLMTVNFPNMFFAYATHGPTALANGPTALVKASLSLIERVLIKRPFRRFKVIGLSNASVS